MASSKDAPRPDTWSGRFSVTADYIYNIPDDLMMNILGRFPVKTLLRFKTVSKHWLSLISNPTFVNIHLRRALESNENLMIHRTSSNSILLRNVDSSVDLRYFGDYLPRDLLIVGSYNGIVCVALNNRCYVGSSAYLCSSGPHTLLIYLWNPATKKAMLLPAPRYLVRNFALEYLGFGFDPIANDFKVVKIVHYNDKDNHATVYSANANAWKQIKCPKVLPRQSISDACVNGVLYWTYYHGVIRYDMNNEVFYNHRFPANVLRTGDRYYLCERIMEMENSISVIMTADMGSFKTKVNMWTVDDGFVRSWTLRYSFETSLVHWVHGYLNSNGEFLFRTRSRSWWLYNLDKNVEKWATVPEGTSEIFKYTESLVPITGSEDLGKMLRKVEMEDQERRYK